MRREPSNDSEMVSQVLFGEEFRIVETRGQWYLISLDFDKYTGWVGTNYVTLIREQNADTVMPVAGYRMVSAPCITVIDRNADRQLILPAGSVLPGTAGKIVKLCGREYALQSETGILVPGQHVDPEPIGTGLFSIPYLWGGRCGFGFDCSGLTQTICRMMGISLPRDSGQQAALGANVNFIHETRKGDMAFFENAEGEIAHVGMLLGNGRILHAYTSVRIDRLDQQGIYDDEKGSYTHRLRVIKRIANGS